MERDEGMATVKQRVKNGSDYGSILSAEQKKKIVKKMRKEGRKKHLSVQDSIPYEAMLFDGICRVNDHYFTKMLEFSDITYSLLCRDDREIIFDGWCALFNYFGPDVHLELTCAVSLSDMEEMKNKVELKEKDDGYEELRGEFSKMLKNKLVTGNNRYERHKYLIYGVEGKSARAVRGRLISIEKDIDDLLYPIGIHTHVLTGYERLKVLRNMLEPCSFSPFLYNQDLTTRTGLTSKDFIAPSGFDFRDSRYFTAGEYIGTSMFFQIQTEKLSDSLMRELLEVNGSIIVSMHVKSMDQEAALKLIKGKLTDIEEMKINEEKRAAVSGYDTDILPPDIKTYDTSMQKTLGDVESGQDRIFIASMVITAMEKTKAKLDRVTEQLMGIARKESCAIKKLDNRQEAGLMTSLPIGVNLLKIESARTTRAVAGLIPFTTAEIYSENEGALYGGVNELSGNLVMIDRKSLDNPNGLILGVPGSGKSFATKEEIISSFFSTDDSIMICDPESEYGALTKALGGQVIVISPNSKDHINPMELNIPEGTDPGDAVKLKVDFVISLMELIVGGKDGLSPIEHTVADLSAGRVYERYLKNGGKAPILEDLYDEIKSSDIPESQALAAKMERFVHGTSSLFNHSTNVDLDNRIICFDIRSLGNQLKAIGMMTVQDEVWSRVTKNRAALKSTRYFMDEFHILLRDERTADYTAQMFKRFRKYGGIPTGITQNITDLLGSSEAANIFSNCEYIRMLKQRGEDREELRDKLHISDEQMKYVTGSRKGSGLLFFGDRIIPVRDDFPKDTKLYALINTKLEDMKEQEAKDE